MTKLAVVHQERILEFVDAAFEAHPDIKFVEVADDTTTRDKYVDGSVTKFVAPVPSVEEVRAIRNARLAESDWTSASDSPLTDEKKSEWATYRQSLRGMPTSYPDISWPDPPS